jgi:predicted AlkP superfamily phosphohydrolase/phosphomutase
METWALNEERMDEATFLEDVYFTEEKFREILLGLLADDEARLVVQVFELTDRVSHMFWRLLDPEHPAYDADLAAEFGDAVKDSYVYMDAVVGDVMGRLGPEDRLVVVSDHGFQTWHKSVNYNTWLVRNGFMTLKRDEDDPEKTLEDLFGQGEFWPNVDWKRTKAYALGLGDIYLNVKGREAQGIVEPGAEYDRIREDLITRLLAFRDPETGLAPVSAVHRREDVYSGYDEDLIPDLLVANAPKYRVSWQTSLGGIPAGLFSVNDRKWSGDHCSLDASITKGIFFASRPIENEEVDILDIHPTVLGWLGLPVEDDVDGKALTESE